MAASEIQSSITNHLSYDRSDLPLVLLYRLPQSELPFKDRLAANFRLIDFHDDGSVADELLLTVRATVTLYPAPITPKLLSRLPKLELVVSTSVGLDKIDLEECRRRRIRITNSSVAFREEVADYAVGLLLDVARRVSAADRFVRAGSWLVKGDYQLGSKVSGKRIGIVGLGNIGWEIAKRLSAFGCTIGYNSRTKKPSAAFQYYANIRDLAAESDVLMLCCALTDETYRVVDKDVLTALGKDGVIINIGRGGLINEKDLVEMLVKGEVGGAGLDVFEAEPKVPEELLGMNNVVLSPHNAVSTPEALGALEELVLGNLKAFFEDKPLSSLVEY